MADKKPRRVPADRARIDIAAEAELRCWSKAFNASPEELKAAVREVGPSAQAVARHLGVPADSEPPAADTPNTTGPH